MSVFAQYLPSGVMLEYAGFTLPVGFLFCDGAAVSRTTYGALFGALSPAVGTFTVTIAAPAVVTLSTHGFQTGDQVYLTTTGALPTGLTVNTLYYVVKVDANSFNLATSRANAYAATKITTSGTQSGTHTCNACPHGLGDGSTTFNVPDSRGRSLAGNDSMNGTAASRLTLAQSQGVYGNLGATGGEQGHTIVTAELASHTHVNNPNSWQQNGSVATGTGAAGWAAGGTPMLTASTGSDTAHNNVQPILLINHIIKT